MREIKTDIHSVLARKYGIRRNVIEVICNHPFIFASRRIGDPDDEKTIMFSYLGKIKMKRKLIGKKRQIYDEEAAKKVLRYENKKRIQLLSVRDNLPENKEESNQV